ncbi:hypothetical protein NC651_016643 [Populus alba x Populus x berolinensis]|nr:hypothetical protein NC651_016643 [Populus alba x Populus x berolinensis]
MVDYNKEFQVNIVETKPSNAISIIDTDCEVDFVPRLDNEEPSKDCTSSCLSQVFLDVWVRNLLQSWLYLIQVLLKKMTKQLTQLQAWALNQRSGLVNIQQRWYGSCLHLERN